MIYKCSICGKEFSGEYAVKQCERHESNVV